MDKLGFDNQKYLELQSAHIREGVNKEKAEEIKAKLEEAGAA